MLMVLDARQFCLVYVTNSFLVKGEGCELTTADGDTYVDFLGEFTAGIYGHSNKLIAAAVAEAMKDGWNFGGPNRFERELARKVSVKAFISLPPISAFPNHKIT